ncbi:MAG: carboxypeptidase-like regulatory domain-containing protein [Novipirellula sp. JB048]
MMHIENQEHIEMKRWSWMLPLALLALLAGLSGCGSAELPTGNVIGTVTHNGEALTAGSVILVNNETGLGASAEIESSGSFQMQSVRTGEYQVAIQSRTAPTPEEMAEGAKASPSTIPEQYRDPQTSGLSLSVSQGENKADIDIPREFQYSGDGV